MNLDRWFPGLPKRQQRFAAWGVVIGAPLLIAGGIAAAMAGDDQTPTETAGTTTTASAIEREGSTTTDETTTTTERPTTTTTAKQTTTTTTTPTTTRVPETTTTTAAAARSPVPRGCRDHSAEDVGKFTTSPREVCELERSICADFGVAKVATEYGADPASPVDVAIALAEATYQFPFQAAATQGCLWGFQDRGEYP